jgi:hypothetical protein
MAHVWVLNPSGRQAKISITPGTHLSDILQKSIEQLAMSKQEQWTLK